MRLKLSPIVLGASVLAILRSKGSENVYGDDYGLRGNRTSAVVVAVVVIRNRQAIVVFIIVQGAAAISTRCIVN